MVIAIVGVKLMKKIQMCSRNLRKLQLHNDEILVYPHTGKVKKGSTITTVFFSLGVIICMKGITNIFLT